MENFNKFKTSANIDGYFYDQIRKAAAIFNINEKIIFKDLICIIITSADCGYITNSLTEYQDHSPQKWETIYYQLDAVEIETFLKARLKYKISISKLAFIGFVLFWNLLLYRYAERIKTSTNEIFSHSYFNFSNKYDHFKEYFEKKFKIIRKE
ncbi:MAG: hypothetical protein JW982_14175 [Spirochaetes bacterium]|nr:hypothetical protein [Spirochaetota bacterium]